MERARTGMRCAVFKRHRRVGNLSTMNAVGHGLDYEGRLVRADAVEGLLVADTCLNDTCAAFSASTSRLNQALIERKTRFGLTCDFVGIREFVSKVLESD